MRKTLVLLLALALVAALTACGGGSSSVAPASVPASVPASAPAPAPSSSTAPPASSEVPAPASSSSVASVSIPVAQLPIITPPPMAAPASSASSKYAPGERTKKLFGDTLSGLKHPLCIKLRMPIDIKGTGKTELVDVVYGSKGGKTATDMTSASTGRISTIFDGEFHYIVMHSEKSIMKMKDTPEDLSFTGMFEQDEAALNELHFTADMEVIDGKAYECDEYVDAGETTHIYFVPGTETWAYMRSGSDIIEVVEYNNNPEDALFTLPSGYQTMDLSAVEGVKLP